MNEEIWTCPNCQSENPSNADFCGECGTPRVTESAPTSANPEGTACPACGAQNSPDAVFCGECGSRIVEEPKQKVCKKCKLIYPFEKRFCLKCGEPLVEKETLIKKKKDKKECLQIAKLSILPLVALLFLVFSFLPIYNISFGNIIGEDIDIPININTIDNIVMLFDILHEDTDSTIEESRLYEKIEEMQEELADELEDVGPSEFDKLKPSVKRMIVKTAKMMVRTQLRMEDMKVSFRFVLNAVFSLIYIVFAVLFFIFSLIEFLKKINGEKTKNIATKFLVFSPFAILLLYFFSKNIFGVVFTLIICDKSMLCITVAVL